MTALGPGHWDQPPLKMDTTGAPEDSGLAFSNLPAPLGQYLFVSDIGQPNLDEKPTLHTADTSLPESAHHPRYPSDTSPMMPFSGGSLYPPQASFTATNADDIKMHDTLDPTTIAPLQTRFDGDPIAYDSHESNVSFSTEGSAYSAASTAPSQWSYAMDRQAYMDKGRRESVQIQVESTPGATGSRRTSDKAEPGSARAVYLEKNRQAASKCRTKQKRQQEDLVETAREVERKNKVLKSEVDFLKSDLRGLMELVGKHNECPDGRLRRYVQLEADRLSARGDQSPIAELLSPKSSFNGDSASPEHL
ncbi:uncharacterized protein N0V89_005957 [Didymosphaeria variabile]|uniref:BZIP domain-containing protein n=1 Tax=Didymosphaeria variabile TaxID=1932322 RepID=A0A9W8XN64_9PLEO|nr:uncharacterized protein N0V89_005957 [Didymosphaeria variabile]KAJ4354223.1 hypothetical protein N0V89_005957 [Didymosphaeria variabile]